jgi:cobalt-zinc-cadmium efflux system outer membrane protein
MRPRNRAAIFSNTTQRSSATAAALLLLAVARPALADVALDETTGAARICGAGPTRAVARALVARAEAESEAAKVLPNPELVVEHERIFTSGGGHETTAGVGVPLGIGGRRSLVREAAGVRRSAARAEASSLLIQQSLEFRERFVEAATGAARVEVLEEQQRALDDLARIIRALSKGGEVAGYDLLRQQTQARAHLRTLSGAKGRAASSRRWLEAWAQSPVRLPTGDLAELGGGAGVLAKLSGARRSEHPRVRALEASAQAAGLEARAARRRAVPDIGVFLGYRTVTEGSGGSARTGHGLRAGVTVPLTFFDHGQGEAARADAEALVARSTASHFRRDGSARIDALSAQLALLEKSRPDAALTARDANLVRDKAKQLYAAGELSITELLEAFRAAEEAQLARIELAEEIAAARLGLMRALGTQLDPRLDAACGSKP